MPLSHYIFWKEESNFHSLKKLKCISWLLSSYIFWKKKKNCMCLLFNFSCNPKKLKKNILCAYFLPFLIIFLFYIFNILFYKTLFWEFRCLYKHYLFSGCSSIQFYNSFLWLSGHNAVPLVTTLISEPTLTQRSRWFP